jgi:hypothetical protein
VAFFPLKGGAPSRIVSASPSCSYGCLLVDGMGTPGERPLASIRRRRERRRSKKRPRSLQSRALLLALSSSLVSGDQSAPQRFRPSDSESGRHAASCAARPLRPRRSQRTASWHLRGLAGCRIRCSNQTTDGHLPRSPEGHRQIKAAKNRQTVQSWRSERTGDARPGHATSH